MHADFLFHTGFVGAGSGGELAVPVQMMDIAFKNKHGRFRDDGEARLRYHVQAEPDGAQEQQPGPTHDNV